MLLILAKDREPTQAIQIIQTIELQIKSNPNSYCFDKKYITIKVNTNLRNFGMKLIDLDPLKLERSAFIEDIEEIEMSNEWLREIYASHNLATADNMDDQYEEVLDLLRKKLRRVAEKHNLEYIEDHDHEDHEDKGDT